MSASLSSVLSVRQAVPAHAQATVDAILDLDEALAQLLRTTSQPVIGQMRLTWWHERLTALGEGATPAHPVLQALGATMGTGARPLVGLIDGWEVLLDETLDDVAVETHGRCRGATLGRVLGSVLGGQEDEAGRVGEAWALADLAAHLSKPEERDLATRRLSAAGAGLPRRLGGPLAPMQPMLLQARAAAGERSGILIGIRNRLAELRSRR